MPHSPALLIWELWGEITWGKDWWQGEVCGGVDASSSLLLSFSCASVGSHTPQAPAPDSSGLNYYLILVLLRGASSTFLVVRK